MGRDGKKPGVQMSSPLGAAAEPACARLSADAVGGAGRVGPALACEAARCVSGGGRAESQAPPAETAWPGGLVAWGPGWHLEGELVS